METNDDKEIRFRQRIRAAIALLLVVTICIQAGFADINPGLLGLAGAAVGFYFKSKTKE
jgi:hypothetical protein